MSKPNPDYPDPCEYCPLMYYQGGSHDCSDDCDKLKEAAKQWAGDEGDEK